MKVKLTGWTAELRKIAFVKLQIDYFQMSLNEAKTNVDNLLEGSEIEIEAESINQAQNFIQEAKQLGVICEIEE
jgi:hypothetical protein